MVTPAQVKRAQAHLLEHLYSAVTTLGGAEAEFLLEEDSDSAVKREKLKQVCITPLVESGLRSELWRASSCPASADVRCLFAQEHRAMQGCTRKWSGQAGFEASSPSVGWSGPQQSRRWQGTNATAQLSGQRLTGSGMLPADRGRSRCSAILLPRSEMVKDSACTICGKPVDGQAAVQSVGEVAQAVAELKTLQEGHYEDTERAAEPLEVPAEIVQLAEYRRRRPSDRSGVHAVRMSGLSHAMELSMQCSVGCSLSFMIPKAYPSGACCFQMHCSSFSLSVLTVASC